MSQITVTWQGHVVGHMTNPRPDMWYLEGAWLSVPGPHTDIFLARTASLDARAIMSGSQRGLVVALTESESSETVAIVMAPPAETLFVRRVFDLEAIKLAKLWESEQA